MKKNCASSWLFTKNFNIYLRNEIDWMLQLRQMSLLSYVQLLFKFCSQVLIYICLNTSHMLDFKPSVLRCSCKKSAIGLISVNKSLLTQGIQLPLCFPPVAQKVGRNNLLIIWFYVTLLIRLYKLRSININKPFTSLSFPDNSCK